MRPIERKSLKKWTRIQGAGHYANDVPDVLFTKAAYSGAQRHAQQKTHETHRNNQNEKRVAGEADDPNSGVFENLRDISVSPFKTIRWSRGELNPRPVVVNMPLLHA